MSIFFILIFILLLVWFWADSMRAREQLLLVCRRACEQAGAQLLDETVSVSRLWPGRTASGRRRLKRHYSFEITLNGAERRPCSAVMLGHQVEYLSLDLPEGPTIFDACKASVQQLH